MNLKERILESSIGYSIWSAPLSVPKMAAIRDILNKTKKTQGRVLDVGCGPGSNAVIFAGNYDYVGIDYNAQYIETATKKYPNMTFKVADATKLALTGNTFDIVLINSLMHHIDDAGCHKLMQDLKPLLNKDAIIIIQEPLIPEKNQHFMRLMMQQDRGDYFRTLEQWNSIFQAAHFTIAEADFYNIKLLNVITGWWMYSVVLREGF
jgi:ubiquinone/menaquinone biosynthesis C-methylase UbiE